MAEEIILIQLKLIKQQIKFSKRYEATNGGGDTILFDTIINYKLNFQRGMRPKMSDEILYVI